MDTYIKFDSGTQKLDELKQFSQKNDEDISIRNMANAILTIQGFFQNGNSIDEFFPFLRSNVLMIYVAAEELEDAFHLFTVMNNRGIKLRNSDILKAENLAKVADASARTKYAKIWESIEDTLLRISTISFRTLEPYLLSKRQVTIFSKSMKTMSMLQKNLTVIQNHILQSRRY